MDAMIKQMKATDKLTGNHKLKKLFEKESYWKRKVTIATNKLADVRDDINKLATEMAGKITPENPIDTK
jgi:hypothetical protein